MAHRAMSPNIAGSAFVRLRVRIDLLQEFRREPDWREVLRLFAHGSFASKTRALRTVLYRGLRPA